MKMIVLGLGVLFLGGCTNEMVGEAVGGAIVGAIVGALGASAGPCDEAFCPRCRHQPCRCKSEVRPPASKGFRTR